MRTNSTKWLKVTKGQIKGVNQRPPKGELNNFVIKLFKESHEPWRNMKGQGSPSLCLYIVISFDEEGIFALDPFPIFYCLNVNEEKLGLDSAQDYLYVRWINVLIDFFLFHAWIWSEIVWYLWMNYSYSSLLLISYVIPIIFLSLGSEIKMK